MTDICFQIPRSPLPMSCCILTPTLSRFYPGLFLIFLGQWLWQGQAYAVASAEPGCPQGLRPPRCRIDLKSVILPTSMCEILILDGANGIGCTRRATMGSSRKGSNHERPGR